MNRQIFPVVVLACVLGLVGASDASAAAAAGNTLTLKDSISTKVLKIPAGFYIPLGGPSGQLQYFEYPSGGMFSLSLSFACNEDPATFTAATGINLLLDTDSTPLALIPSLMPTPSRAPIPSLAPPASLIMLGNDPKYKPGISTSGKIDFGTFDIYGGKFIKLFTLTWKLSNHVFSLSLKTKKIPYLSTFAAQFINLGTNGPGGVRFPAGVTTAAAPYMITASIAATTKVYNATYNVTATNTPFGDTGLWQGKATGTINYTEP